MRSLQRLATLVVRPRRGATHGGIAVQFALLILPLAVLTFGLIDVNRASSGKRRLQDALDAATLAAARSSAITEADLQTVGSKMLAANLKSMGDATFGDVKFTIEGPKVVATASAKVQPIISNLWLQGDMSVSATSEVFRSMNKVEVALVLDNTGSMAGTKLSKLKDAANDFVDHLAAAASRSTEVDPVKIGIVPFSNAVRLSDDNTQLAAYQAANWMDKGTAPISGDIFNGKMGVNRFTLLSGMKKSWTGCVENRQIPYDVQESPPTASTPASLYTPFFWPDAADGDSNGNKYRDDGAYTTQTGGTSSDDWKMRQGFAGKYTASGTKTGGSGDPNKGCDMQPITRLTTDWSVLKNHINDMNAAGETHIPIGLMWGWHVLSPSAPFADGVAYSEPKTAKIVVLMTDGDNTYTSSGGNNGSNYDGYGFFWNKRLGVDSGNRTEAIDNRLALLCSNMKAQGIILYTIRVEVKTGSSKLLSTCASQPTSEHFYDVQNASNLNAVFSAIAGSIENLRLSK